MRVGIAPGLRQYEQQVQPPIDIGYTIGVEVWDYPYDTYQSGDPTSPYFVGPPAPATTSKWWLWLLLGLGAVALVSGKRQ